MELPYFSEQLFFFGGGGGVLPEKKILALLINYIQVMCDPTTDVSALEKNV